MCHQGDICIFSRATDTKLALEKKIPSFSHSRNGQCHLAAVFIGLEQNQVAIIICRL